MITQIKTQEQPNQTTGKWIEIIREISPDFASRAAAHDAEGTFVAENYEILKQRKLFSAAVPAELAGGGASHEEMCEVLRELAHYDGSTALAFAMHSHLLATFNWRYKNGLTPSSEPALRRIAAEELVLVSTGGSDWLDGSGVAVKDGEGFRISGRKIFGSGSPGGDLLVTMAVYDDPESGPTVLHFAVNLKGEGVTVTNDWDTLGMRSTGSNTILLDSIFVPDGAISLRRPPGKWHPFFDVISPIAFSLIMAVYVGVAESARNQALPFAMRKKEDPLVQELVGKMDTELLIAQSAYEKMVSIAVDGKKPNAERSNRVFQHKTAAVQSAIKAVETAMMVAGGQSFFRSAGIERCFRDIQAARFHPWQEHRQHQFSGRIAMGLDPIE